MSKRLLPLFILVSLMLLPDLPAADAERSAGSGGAVDLRGYFPEAGSIDSRMEAEEYQEYGRGMLYDYINGGAEVYLDLEFVKVGARDYVIQLEEETYFTLDVYDMAKPVNAFGIYSAESHGDIPAVDVGVAGYMGGGALTFWIQRYYVKIRADDDSDAVNGMLKKMAGIVSSRIGDPGRVPPDMDLFPARDRVPASERYAARNLMGVGPLKGFSTRFEKNGQEITLHLCHFDSEAEAAGAEKALAKRVGTSPDGSTGGRAYAFASKYFGNGRILRVKSYIAIAQGSAGEEAGGSWASDLVDEFFKVVTAAGST
jgi:hypothetical protein